MVAIIKCQTCQEVLGTIEKDVISANDIAAYTASCTCSQGHTTVTLDIDEASQDGAGQESSD